jgi:hypothetical protein
MTTTRLARRRLPPPDPFAAAAEFVALAGTLTELVRELSADTKAAATVVAEVRAIAEHARATAEAADHLVHEARRTSQEIREKCDGCYRPVHDQLKDLQGRVKALEGGGAS